MNDSDKIAITGIVINAVMIIVGWFVQWFITKKASQARSPVTKPVAKPTRERRRQLTPIERRLIRDFRFLQLYFVFVIIGVPVGYFAFNSFPPASKIDVVNMIVSVVSVVVFGIAIINIEVTTIRQIKSGDFMKPQQRKN